MRRTSIVLLTAFLVASSVVRLIGHGQADQNTPGFEVASVKRNTSGDTNALLRRPPGGRVDAINMPVRGLILYAYPVGNFRLVGGPGWINDEGYDVVAKLEGNPAPTPPPGIDAARLAMRRLLADRFKLQVHTESREMDIYALVMVKPGTPGPALKPSAGDCASQAAGAARGTRPPDAPFCGVGGNDFSMRFGGLPASEIANAFVRLAKRPVVDRTGLTGSWEFSLTFAPEPAGRGDTAPAGDPTLPSFFTAVQEQLGLKLQPTKGPVDVLVIDHVERPTLD